jgi:8-oxo-dGTP pyrophosphatase MutT (NUDIX family)
LPVAVLIQPVKSFDHKRTGILIGKRGIHPQKGEWNIIAGHIDPKDASVEHAAIREMKEEAGLDVDLSMVKIVSSFSNGGHVLIFCESTQTVQEYDLDAFFEPNYECPEIRVAWEPEELCFQSHTRAMAAWFEKNTVAKNTA